MINLSVIDSAVKFMRDIAADNSHGYSQVNRWGPDYDCSSLIITAYERAGVPVKSSGATYTGNMASIFKKCGFTDVTSKVNLASGYGLEVGDVLLNRVKHTAMYIGNGKICHARSSEGNTQTGDQSGNEIREQGYFNYPWNVVLRYSGTSASISKPQSSTTATNTPTCNPRLPILSYGSSEREAVITLQHRLMDKGYDIGAKSPDGDFGSKTKQAVMDLQKKHGKAVDGKVGADTWPLIIN